MAGVLSEDPQAPFTGDQQLIQASAAGVADLTFGERVRTASSATARADDRYRRVRVTHRFHPQSVSRRSAWTRKQATGTTNRVRKQARVGGMINEYRLVA